MFVLICATLLFSVRRISAATDGSVTWCFNEYCITVREGEIAAEAGLCVVIPCSFTTAYGFTPKHLVWYKCEPSNQKCGDSNMIFHSNKGNKKVQAGFRGRVSLLEPDVRLKNCSIIINDLTESDSGSYQLRVNGLLKNRKEDGVTFNQKVTISVKGLTQKPTVGIPPLAEGQQTTLSCTAPGLCSGSDPEITWTWRGAGEKDSPITGSITAVKTENLTSVTRRRSSTLTFNPSAEHHGTNVTCKVSFTNNITTEETVTLDVTYVKDLNISRNTSVKEGEPLNLTCGVESFPPSLITWTRSPETHTQNQTDTHWHNNTFTQRASGMSTFYVLNVTPEYSGRYICTAKHLDRTLEQYVDVNVIYVRSPVITGSTTALEGGALNLTCAVESFPPSRVTWAASGTTRRRGLDADRQNGTGSAASLVIPDVAAEDSGRYTCTAEHPDGTVTAYADVTVTWPPRFSNSSRCDVRSEVVTCVCVSEGLPLPSISWPLLKNHSEYSVVTTVSGHAVNSTATLTLRDHVGTSVQCVSSNDHGEAREDLRVQQTTWDTEELPSGPVPWLQVVVAFFIGVLLSAALCCLVTRCRRKKQKISSNQDETHEMVTSHEAPLMNGARAVEDDRTHYQESAEGERGAAPDVDGEPKDVLYANIDFSLLSRKSLGGAARSREATETEYAEIQKVAEEQMDNGGGEGVNASGGSMAGEDGEDEVAVYSSVKDVTSEICCIVGEASLLPAAVMNGPDGLMEGPVIFRGHIPPSGEVTPANPPL